MIIQILTSVSTFADRKRDKRQVRNHLKDFKNRLTKLWVAGRHHHLSLMPLQEKSEPVVSNWNTKSMQGSSGEGIALACGMLSGVLWRQSGKRKESLQLYLWNLNICIEKVNEKCWLVEVTLVMMSLPLVCVFQCLFTLPLISALRWLAEIWQLSWQGAIGELEVEFKFQRHSCNSSPSFSRLAARVPWRAYS